MNNVTGVNFWRGYQFCDKMRQKGIDTAIFGWGLNINYVGEWEQRFAKDKKLREILYSLLNRCDIAIFQYIH